MRPGEIIEPLSVSEMFLEIDIIFVGEELVELLFVSAMRALIPLRAEVTLDVRSQKVRELGRFALWPSDRCNEDSFSCNVRAVMEEMAATRPVFLSEKLQMK